MSDAKKPDDTNPKDRLGDLKPPLHLVPPALRIYAAQAMADGAKKYGPYNWREKKVRATVYLSAAARHLDSWLDGEECAQDSGRPHLAHAVASLAILIDALETGNLIDDRPVKGAASSMIEAFAAKATAARATAEIREIADTPVRMACTDPDCDCRPRDVQ